jgi:hypothetical protein
MTTWLPFSQEVVMEDISATAELANAKNVSVAVSLST